MHQINKLIFKEVLIGYFIFSETCDQQNQIITAVQGRL